MPKLKTHKGAAKRFKVLKGGKIKRARANKRHLLECKDTQMKRQARRSNYVHASDVKEVRQMLPYG